MLWGMACERIISYGVWLPEGGGGGAAYELQNNAVFPGKCMAQGSWRLVHVYIYIYVDLGT